MQDRYAGDVGDFGKFALLRALAPGRRLGICWYRTDGAGETTNDGKHLSYLDQPERFRALDPGAFDTLRRFIQDVQAGGRSRSLGSLEALGLVPPDTRFHGSRCPTSFHTRSEWARGMVTTMEGSDLVFLDPDNGLETQQLSPKSAALSELQALRRPGRAVLLYHHQTRFPGGAAAEFSHISQRLLASGFERVQAVRLRPYSSRFYLLLDGDSSLDERLVRFAETWGPAAEHFPSVSKR